MKNTTYLLLLVCLLFSCNNENTKKTQLTILGTVHFPTEKVNADSIYQILKLVQPDVILMESDSSNFNEDFSFKNTYDENEYNATIKYRKEFPEVIVRPIGFEGRNAYRKKIGIFSEAGFVYGLLNDLYDEGKLSPSEKKTWDDFGTLWDSLEQINVSSLSKINQKETDELITAVTDYQYIKTRDIVNEKEIFAKGEITDAKKDTVTLRDYFNKWAHFEHSQRQDSMVNNVLTMVKEFPEKRLIVLTGFKHRYYILDGLKEHIDKEQVELLEYYDYPDEG